MTFKTQETKTVVKCRKCGVFPMNGLRSDIQRKCPQCHSRLYVAPHILVQFGEGKPKERSIHGFQIQPNRCWIVKT